MLTVLMATHNGAKTLPRVLDAYLDLHEPPGGWKAIIVDNASTDDTADTVLSYAGHLPILLVREPRRGKNWGLNTGLQHVEGDLVVFTDDDIVPDPDWLVRMRQVADDQPDYDVFGGKIEPIWLHSPVMAV